MKERLRAASRELGAALKRHAPHVLCDVMGYTGAGAVSYGAWLIYEPAGYIVGGLILMTVACAVGLRVNRDRAQT